MKYSLTAAALSQPPGSRNQESRHIRLLVKAAVLVPPQGRDSHRKHQWGWYFQARLEEPPTTLAILFSARTWKQPRCPSTEEWIRKMWYIYTMEYYTAEKNNDIMKFAGKWMELENVILSE
ncbi:hypothetical protein STEG23_007704, partial [Scotinomys teguina]